ncbi:MAG: S8 family peptidase [Candidatus Eremiobacterota bacterium]
MTVPSVPVLIMAGPGQLRQVREALGARDWTDLELIDGAAARLEPEQVARVRSWPGVRLVDDGSLELAPAVDVRPRLETAAPTVRAPELWELGHTGKGVTVAVVDTGTTRHRDFSGRLVAFHDCVSGRTEPYDDHGHGTHVTGIVAGDGSDSKGKHRGIAPECSVVAIKAFDRHGKARMSDVIKAIQWAVENRERHGIRVLNLSAAGRAQLSHQHDPLARAAAAAARHGILVVAAAGNDGPDPATIGTPAHSPAVLTVGASDDRGTVRRDDDRVASLSSRGPTPVDGLTKPDVVAPGVGITSAYNGSKGYATKSGTSMAAPMVAGLAALLLSAHPEADPAALRGALVGTAEELEKGGDANTQGAGLVDGRAALDRLHKWARAERG